LAGHAGCGKYRTIRVHGYSDPYAAALKIHAKASAHTQTHSLLVLFQRRIKLSPNTVNLRSKVLKACQSLEELLLHFLEAILKI